MVTTIDVWPGFALSFEIAGLQPFPRDLNDKDPGGHVGWQEQ